VANFEFVGFSFYEGMRPGLKKALSVYRPKKIHCPKLSGSRTYLKPLHWCQILSLLIFFTFIMACVHCNALHCNALHCTACTALHCTALHCNALHCTARHLHGRGIDSCARVEGRLRARLRWDMEGVVLRCVVCSCKLHFRVCGSNPAFQRCCGCGDGPPCT
jgi:hypothetical protein